MILLHIEDNWYYFLVFAGCLIIIAGIVLFFESRREGDSILEINPLLVVRNILVNQIGFYASYLLLIFTIDVISAERFSWTQVFAGIDYSFLTKRGLLTGLGYILGFSATSLVTTSTIQTYKNMLDYCFTVFIIHFIVVSIVENQFPAYGAWWTASGIGVVLFMVFSERFSYYLETMPYQSNLDAKNRSRKSTEIPTIEKKDQIISTENKKEEEMKELNISKDDFSEKNTTSLNNFSQSKDDPLESKSNMKEDNNVGKSNSFNDSNLLQKTNSKDNKKEAKRMNSKEKELDEKNRSLNRLGRSFSSPETEQKEVIISSTKRKSASDVKESPPVTLKQSPKMKALREERRDRSGSLVLEDPNNPKLRDSDSESSAVE